jgi:extracellular factor (EF) 3-hydroxypalmitic acid methyl ester biosynthesis protein
MPSPTMTEMGVSSARQQIEYAAASCSRALALLDRLARKNGRSIPTDSGKELVTEELWKFARVLDATVQEFDAATAEVISSVVREQIHPWLLRSRLWSRAYLKPHGFPGDYRMVEWMYDLEEDACEDPTQPAIVNCLDYAMRSVHSVQAVWHRRRWFRALIEQVQGRLDRPVRVLDIASGGSRYCRDFMDCHPDQLELTVVDQDPSAIAYVRSWLDPSTREQHRLLCSPVKSMPDLFPVPRERGTFDVVISTGLFDYLSNAAASELLDQMMQLTAPNGVTAICNFAPDDPSRVFKTWFCDWHLVYRDEAELRSLFPRTVPTIDVSSSADGSLLYASAESR